MQWCSILSMIDMYQGSKCPTNSIYHHTAPHTLQDTLQDNLEVYQVFRSDNSTQPDTSPGNSVFILKDSNFKYLFGFIIESMKLHYK